MRKKWPSVSGRSELFNQSIGLLGNFSNVMRTRRSQFSGDPMPGSEVGHRTVLLHEAIESLQIQRDDVIVDATLGGAGHAKAIVDLLGKGGRFIGIDLDRDAIGRGEVLLKDAEAHVDLVEANFRDIRKSLASLGVTHITKVLFDLGWSSYQLDSGRGFSLAKDEPLVMTYSKEGGAVTAATIINTWKEETLADIFFGFGEERYARRIAKAIVERRVQRTFSTALELADFIKTIVPVGYAHGRIHPATKVFQALRIAVNDEFGALAEGLREAFDLLAEGGRMAVITFHSSEDRIVKRYFATLEKEGQAQKLSKKPIPPGDEEIQSNRRARSAKLRAIQKISHDQTHTQDQQIPPIDTPR